MAHGARRLLACRGPHRRRPPARGRLRAPRRQLDPLAPRRPARQARGVAVGHRTAGHRRSAAAEPRHPDRRGRRLRPPRPPEDALGPRRGRDARRARRVPGPARRPQGPRRPAALAHPVPRRRRRLRLRGVGALDDARALRHPRAAALRPGRPADDRPAPARRDDRRPRGPLRGRGPGPRAGARRAGRLRRRAPAAHDDARLPAGRRAGRGRGADACARGACGRRRARAHPPRAPGAVAGARPHGARRPGGDRRRDRADQPLAGHRARAGPPDARRRGGPARRPGSPHPDPRASRLVDPLLAEWLRRR